MYWRRNRSLECTNMIMLLTQVTTGIFQLYYLVIRCLKDKSTWNQQHNFSEKHGILFKRHFKLGQPWIINWASYFSHFMSLSRTIRLHDIQLSKLWKLRFENYLQCRTQSVKATISSYVATVCGIPQGSIQGPRIF